MPDLNDELSHFAGAIVLGDVPSSRIDSGYPNYSAPIAIEVYRNNYRGNLHDALAGAYPVIKQLVGDDFFRLLARKFIERHPSRSANLHRYGAELADFVAGFAPAQDLVYLSDVAALEWACHLAYFAADEATLDLGRLAKIPPEHYPDLILHTHRGCRTVRSRYPIAAIWQAHQPGADSEFAIDLDSGHCIALVSRLEDVVLVSELPEANVEFLRRIEAGGPLGTSAIATLERFPAFDLQAALLNLAAHGVLTDFSLNTMP